MPATPTGLRQYFEQASPASGGFGKGHWRNIRSRSLAALRRAGVRTMARRTRQPLAPKWDDLRVLLPATKFRAGLSRFMSFCSAENISPDEVTSGTFDRFGLAIRNDSISPQPRQVYRTACLLWNKATVEIAGWPAVKVPIPSGTRRYALDWQDFPPAFQADVEAYLNRLGNQAPFADDYAPSVRPSTTALRRNQSGRSPPVWSCPACGSNRSPPWHFSCSRPTRRARCGFSSIVPAARKPCICTSRQFC